MKRTLRILRRLLLATVVLGAASLAAWVFLLPGFVEGRIRQALADAGLPDAAFRLREVSLTGAVLTDVSLDPDSHVTVGSIAVDYDIDSLKASRVRTITVTGLVLRVGIRPDGSLDLGPLDDLRTGEEDAGGELPFDRVRIRAARLDVERGEETWRVPFDAELLPGDGELAASGVVAVLNRELRIDAKWETATGAVEATAELSGSPGERVDLRVSSAGDVTDGDLTVTVRAERRIFDGVLAGHRIRLERPSIDGRLELAGFTRLTTAELETTFDALALDGRKLGAGEIEIRPMEDGFDVEATLRRDATTATFFTSLPPLELDRLLEEDRALEVSLELVHGEDLAIEPLPREVAKALAAFGIRAGLAHAEAEALLDLTVGPSGWSATVGKASLLLDVPELLRRDGTGVRDLSLDARVTGRITPELVELGTDEHFEIAGTPVVPGVLAGGQSSVLFDPENPATFRFEIPTGQWRLAIPEARIQSEIGEPAIAGASADLLRLGFAARLEADGAGVEAVLVSDLSGDLAGLRVAGTGPANALLVLREGARVAWRGAPTDLEFRVPAAELSARADRIDPSESIRLERLEALIFAGFEGTLTEITGTVRGRSGLSVRRASAGGHEVSPVQVAVRDDDPVRFRLEITDAWRIAFDGAAELGGFRVDGPTAKATVESLRVGGSLVLDAGGLAGAGGIARFRASELLVPELGIELADLEGGIPLGGGDETLLQESAWLVREGFFRTDRLSWRGKDLPPLAIDLAREGLKMRFAAKWQLTEKAALAAEGTALLRGGVPVTEMSLRVPRFALAPGGRISDALARATGYTFTGEAEMDGKIGYSALGLRPSVRIRVHDATVTSADEERSFQGVDADVRILDLNTFETPGAQSISFREAKVGDIVVSDGSLRFQIEGLRSILLERAEWRLGETGRFWAYAIRLDPQAPDVDAELFMENLSLADWLSVVTVDNATGDGRLYGRLRLQVRTKPRLKVTLGEGFLHAEGDGTISLKDPELAREVLDRHLPDQGGGDEDYNAIVKDRIVKTLEAFAFEDLKFDITERSTGAMRLSLHVAGKGREPPHQELDLTVNVNGFEELIGPALAVKLKIDEGKKSFLDRLKIE